MFELEVFNLEEAGKIQSGSLCLARGFALDSKRCSLESRSFVELAVSIWIQVKKLELYPGHGTKLLKTFSSSKQETRRRLDHVQEVILY